MILSVHKFLNPLKFVVFVVAQAAAAATVMNCL